jgi:hypothetical protein
MSVRRRLTVRSEAVVGSFTPLGFESDDAALDVDQALALRIVQGQQEVRRRQPGDLDRELNVEASAQDRQSPDHPECRADVPIHPYERVAP